MTMSDQPQDEGEQSVVELDLDEPADVYVVINDDLYEPPTGDDIRERIEALRPLKDLFDEDVHVSVLQQSTYDGIRGADQ